MERTTPEKMLASWPHQEEAAVYLTVEHAIQEHVLLLEDTNQKIQYQKEILEKLAELLQDTHLHAALNNPLSVDFLSAALGCMDVLETQLVTLGAEYRKESEREYTKSIHCIREKFYLLALLQKNIPIISTNLASLELKIADFFRDDSLPHMKLLVNPSDFDVSIDDDTPSLQNMRPPLALPAIKIAYVQKKIWNENGLKAKEYLQTYQRGCNFYLLNHQKLPHYAYIPELLAKYSRYKNNIENYFEKLKKISFEKQEEYCTILRECNKTIGNHVDPRNIKTHTESIQQFIKGLSVFEAEIDTHPFMRTEFKALLRKTKRVHGSRVSENNNTIYSHLNSQLPICKIEITPVEKSQLAEILKQKDIVWGWRKLPKNCELGFADESGNYIHDERIPYSNTLYFIAACSKKIKAQHTQKPNSKKTLQVSEGLLFKGIKNECDFTPFDPTDISPTKILYSRGGNYYIKQGETHEYAYAIDRIVALTKNLPVLTLDLPSGKIQNPTTNEKSLPL